jgi:biotin carboxyl carrier protein
MRRLRITIGNKSYDVMVEDMTEADSYQLPSTSARPTPEAAAPPQPTQSPTRAQPQLPIDTGAVTSPMAGQIKSVLVKQGDSVKKGQPLVILEAMKMENQITAPVGGTVKSLGVAEGDSVREGHVLLVLE